MDFLGHFAGTCLRTEKRWSNLRKRGMLSLPTHCPPWSSQNAPIFLPSTTCFLCQFSGADRGFQSHCFICCDASHLWQWLRNTPQWPTQLLSYWKYSCCQNVSSSNAGQLLELDLQLTMINWLFFHCYCWTYCARFKLQAKHVEILW